MQSPDMLEALLDLSEQMAADHFENPALVGGWLVMLAKALRDPDTPEPGVTELTTFGRLVHDEAYRPNVLDWLATNNDVITEDIRMAMEVAFLELLPEEPASEDVLEAIWSRFWPVRELRWIVWSCYGTVPGRLKRDYNRYRSKAAEDEADFPALDVDEYRTWRDENAV